MKIEKKVIALSVIVIMVGVASIVPLLFSMSPKTETPKAWFSIDFPYAYLETREGAINRSNPLGDTINVTDHPVFSNRFGYVFNLTMNANLKMETDDLRVEYYQINITSDKGPLETNSFSVGTSSNISAIPPKDIHFMQNQTYDGAFSGGSGLFIAGWAKGYSRLWEDGTSGTGTSNGLFVAIREAQTVYITLYRVGWVSYNGNSTVVTYTNDEVVCQIQLERFTYNSWLYNDEFLPMSRLVQIDPVKPAVLDPKTGEFVPNV